MSDLKTTMGHGTALLCAVGVTGLYYLFFGSFWLNVCVFFVALGIAYAGYTGKLPSPTGTVAAGVMIGIPLSWLIGKIIFWAFAVAVVFLVIALVGSRRAKKGGGGTAPV